MTICSAGGANERINATKRGLPIIRGNDVAMLHEARLYSLGWEKVSAKTVVSTREEGGKKVGSS